MRSPGSLSALKGLLMCALVLGQHACACAALPRRPVNHAARGGGLRRGRALAQTQEQQIASEAIAAAADTTDKFGAMVGALAEGADAASKAVEAASKIASFASFASNALGFVGPIVSLAFTILGQDSATDTLIKEGFKEVNGKLDLILADLSTLRSDIATVVDYAVANSDWNSLALKARAVSTRLNEMLRNPDDQATRENLRIRCQEEDPLGVVAEFHNVVLCEGQDNCLRTLMMKKAEFEMHYLLILATLLCTLMAMQIPFFDMARVIMRDVGLAQEMALVCANLEGLQQSTIDDRRSQVGTMSAAIAEKLKATFDSLTTEFWRTAVDIRIRKWIGDHKDDANEVLAQSIWADLDSRYPFMYWYVAVYTGRGWDNHAHWGCDFTNGQFPEDCVKNGASVLFDFDVFSTGKNVMVAFNPMWWASVDDPDARLGDLLANSCSGRGGVSELSDCLHEQEGVFGVAVVKFGNGWRGYGSNGGTTGIAVRSGSGEGATVGAGEVSVLANIGSNTQDLWSASPLVDFTAPAPPDSPALPASPSPSPSPTSSFVCMPGGDLMGDELTMYSVGSQQECESACQADTSCTFFVHLVDGRCILKYNLITGSAGSFNVDSSQFAATCVRSDVVSPYASGVACVSNFDMMGTNLEILAGVADSAACQSACFANPACSFFIYTVDGTCAVKGDFLAGSDGTNSISSAIEMTCLRTIEVV